MKIIALGDTHGFDTWKQIVNKETFDKMVFIGDYFDSFQVTTEKQVNNFLDIIAYKKSRPDDVILLIGNHDHHYFAAVGNCGTSGYQALGSVMITPVLEANKEFVQMAYQTDNLLFTHAGVGESFMDACFGKDGWLFSDIAKDLNELQLHKPLAFVFNGRDYSGDDMGQTPIWIRPRSLMRDSQLIKQAGWTQIVGHTHQRCIDFKDAGYVFIDTLPKEYLIIDNGKFKTGKI